MSLLSLSEVREALLFGASDTASDVQLMGFIAAVTSVVEQHVGQTIDRKTVTERLRLRGQRVFTLKHYPVVSLTSLTGLTGAAWDVTGMDVDPDTGAVEVFRGSAPCGTVVAVYEAGYASPPVNYRRGAMVILQHVWEAQRGVGNTGMGVLGEEERLNRGWMYEIPRKALEWLGPAAPGVG